VLHLLLGQSVYTAWRRKVSHYQMINNRIKSYVNEIRFIRQIKV